MTTLAAVLMAVAVIASADDGDVKWSVAPADASGPDGRVVIDHQLDPGDSVTDHLAVTNHGTSDVTFQVASADGYFTRTGRFDMLTRDQESTGSGTWIELPDQITVGAGEEVVIPFSLTVPDNAEPGDYAAGIATFIVTVQTSDSGAGVGIESRVAVRVNTRVTGEIKPKVSITSLDARYEHSWHPFRPGSVTALFELTNDGNTRLILDGQFSIGGQTVRYPLDGEQRQELLPGDSRQFTVTVDRVWPLVAVTGTLIAEPEVVTMEDAAPRIEAAVQQVTVTAIPWPHLALLSGVLLVGVALLWGRVRARRRLAEMLRQAREQGRQDARRTEETP